MRAARMRNDIALIIKRHRAGKGRCRRIMPNGDKHAMHGNHFIVTAIRCGKSQSGDTRLITKNLCHLPVPFDGNIGFFKQPLLHDLLGS